MMINRVNRLKAMRLRRRMTQREVGVAAGLDPSYVSTLECCDSIAPRADTLLRLAQALRCRIDDLLPERMESRRR